MTFSHPWHLIAVILAPLAFFFVYRALERRDAALALTYSSLKFLDDERIGRSRAPDIVRAVLLFGAALLGIAWAGPRLSLHLPSRDGTVIICIDTSGSMASSDVEPTRSQAASKAAAQFVHELPDGVRVGIVAFSTEAQSVLSPTADRDAVADGIARIPPPNGATAIGDALDLAGQMLPQSGRRAVILLTDGVNNRGSDPLEVARTLASRHITLFTVGIGTNGSGQLIPGTDEEADADPDALREYADITHGTFFQVTNAEQIASAFSTLARGAIWEERKIDASLAFAFAGALVIIAGFLGGFAYGRFP